MQGDVIIVEAHHARAGKETVRLLLPDIRATAGKYALSVAGESGSGKSETATAIANALEEESMASVILQQDDYYVYPPKTNDATRRKDPDWLGPKEVRLDVLEASVRDILDGKVTIQKPLINYEQDCITTETLPVDKARVVITEGTYTSLLKSVHARIFIARNYTDTLAHRQKRQRDKAELDDFTANILIREHDIIAAHRDIADIVITRDYEVEDRR